MMSRLPRPASTFFQALKPFSPLVWQLFVTVICLVSVTIFVFNKVYNSKGVRIPGAPSAFPFHDVVYNVSVKTETQSLMFVLPSRCFERFSGMAMAFGLLVIGQNLASILSLSIPFLAASWCLSFIMWVALIYCSYFSDYMLIIRA